MQGSTSKSRFWQIKRHSRLQVRGVAGVVKITNIAAEVILSLPMTDLVSYILLYVIPSATCDGWVCTKAGIGERIMMPPPSPSPLPHPLAYMYVHNNLGQLGNLSN